MNTLKPLAWSLSREDWSKVCQEAALPQFRAKQIWKWLYQRRVKDFESMTDLPLDVRRLLSEQYDPSAWLSSTGEDGDGVRKLLLECRDGQRIESVIISARERATLCVSTQAGCAFGCAFCATGTCGLVRNLEVGEIVGQFMAAEAIAPRRITHIVFMGMGEPFANYEKTLAAVRIFNDFDGIAIGARRMTISTCGLVPGIQRLADEKLQVELSVSLHAPDDDLRSSIMPVNDRWPLGVLIETCGDYTRKTGRVITFEYTLVDKLNSLPEHAEALVGLVKPIRGRVNLIPLSKVAHFQGEPPDRERCQTFAKLLEDAGINVTLRKSKGNNVSAACGQLRLNRNNIDAK